MSNQKMTRVLQEKRIGTSNPELDRLLRESAKREVTPTERREQQISYVYGDLNIDKDSGITKEDIRQRFLEDHGVPLDQHQAIVAGHRDLLRILACVCPWVGKRAETTIEKGIATGLKAQIEAALSVHGVEPKRHEDAA